MWANILASGVSQKEHLRILQDTAALRFASLEVEKVLVYLIDTVDADALYFLAEQFDLLGYRGWKLVKTEAEKRALIKKAILLHRYKGTIYGIKEALKSIGFYNTVIQEHINFLYDGSLDHDGEEQYGGNEWATFRVILDLGNDKGISNEQTAELVELIKEYKNVRSHLLGIAWKASLDDQANAVDELQITVFYSEFVDTPVEGIYYNGQGNYNAEHRHKKEQDVLSVNII